MCKISPPPGFDLRTFQTVASRYTDWDVPGHKGTSGTSKNGRFWVAVTYSTADRRRVPLDFVTFWKVQTDCRTRPAYHSVGTGNSFPAGDFMEQANDNFVFILFHIPQTTNMLTKLIFFHIIQRTIASRAFATCVQFCQPQCKFLLLHPFLHFAFFNHLTPNDHFSGRTAPLTSRCCIFYLFNKYTYWIF